MTVPLRPPDEDDEAVRYSLVKDGKTLDQARDAVDESGVFRWVRDHDPRYDEE